MTIEEIDIAANSYAWSQNERETVKKIAKQQSIEFFKFNAKHIAEYLAYLRKADLSLGKSEYEAEMDIYENATMELRYDLFIQSNKQ